MRIRNCQFAVLGLVIVLLLPVAARADSFSFSPNPANLGDLDHYYYYGWQINNNSYHSYTGLSLLASELSSGYVITGATLTFKNIYDWQAETDDQLAIYLTQPAPVKPDSGSWLNSSREVWQNNDNQSISTTAYLNGLTYTAVTPIWNDPTTGQSAGIARNFDLVYDLAHLNVNGTASISSTGEIVPGSINILGILQAYAKDGNFGFIMDPDCHYYNSGVILNITTSPIPEPASLLLLGIGLIGISLTARRRGK